MIRRCVTRTEELAVDDWFLARSGNPFLFLFFSYFYFYFYFIPNRRGVEARIGYLQREKPREKEKERGSRASGRSSHSRFYNLTLRILARARATSESQHGRENSCSLLCKNEESNVNEAREVHGRGTSSRNGSLLSRGSSESSDAAHVDI